MKPSSLPGAPFGFFLRARWLSMRLLILFLVILAMLTASLSAHLLAPLYSWMAYGDVRFWRRFGDLRRATWQVWRVVFRMLREPGYRQMTALLSPAVWLARPMMGPDTSVVSLRPDWRHGAHSCGNCGRCCTAIGCPSFDTKTKLCLAYGSPFWRYFPCGRYPETQAQIDYYGCPKWQLIAELPSAGPGGERGPLNVPTRTLGRIVEQAPVPSPPLPKQAR